MGYKTELQGNNVDLQSVLDAVNALPEAITPETPVISVSSSGLVTAEANDLSATKQLTNADDSNFVPENIKSGVSIFGVTGTASGGFPNGTEWTQSNITSGTFRSIFAANGVIVAAGYNGMYYSIDGKIWTPSNITSGAFQHVYYANNIWVASNFGELGLYYSTDGKTWTQSNVTTYNFQKAIYGNGIWVAACDSSNKGLYYSTDGKTWTQSSTAGYFNGIYYADGMWLANCYSGYGTAVEGLHYSTNGKTWTACNTSSYHTIHKANGLWVASGSGIVYSTDGKTWTQSNVTSNSNTGLWYANGIWVCSGTTANRGFMYSTDGKTWTQSNITGVYSTCFYNTCGIWVASTYFGSTRGLYYSTDGMTWIDSNVKDSTNSYWVVCNYNGIWLAGGNNGLYYSVTWEPS